MLRIRITCLTERLENKVREASNLDFVTLQCSVNDVYYRIYNLFRALKSSILDVFT